MSPDARPPLQDVFTPDELARAAGVPRQTVDALSRAGGLPFVPGTRFIAPEDALRAGRRLRSLAALAANDLVRAPGALFSMPAGTVPLAHRERRLPVYASGLVHACALALVALLTSGSTETAVARAPEEARLVFLATPGPGGGGGGSGLRNPLPPPRIERRGAPRARVAVPQARPDAVVAARREPEPRPAPAPEPKPIERAPEPLPSQVLLAPVAPAAPDARDREGTIEAPRDLADSSGAGAGGAAGGGRGLGNGDGLGAGIGEGAGGGTGGGPFRPGSGIEPPRLVREVKARFTDEARRRNVTGDVVLEIVVLRDGTVGEITVIRGLGAGLDREAVNAVRQWRFEPARRKGVPVDVVVEVAVEFTLR